MNPVLCFSAFRQPSLNRPSHNRPVSIARRHRTIASSGFVFLLAFANLANCSAPVFAQNLPAGNPAPLVGNTHQEYFSENKVLSPLATPLLSGPDKKGGWPSNQDVKNPLFEGVAQAGFDAATPAKLPYQITGRFHLGEGSNQGYLILQVQLAPGAYIHSLTQPGDFNPSVITVTGSPDFQVDGKFYSDRAPAVIERDPVFQQRLEKHIGEVQFFIPLVVRPGANVEQIKPQLVFSGQVCTDEGTCLPLNKHAVIAEFGGFFQQSAQRSGAARK